MSSISPIDGRYKQNVSELEAYFSEQALMRYRVMVEVKYLLALVDCKPLHKTRSLSKKALTSLKNLYVEFSAKDFKQIKKIEEKTNHDVNAVVVFISEKLKKAGRNDLVPLVHLGLTSEDINNTAYSLMTKGAVENIMVPSIKGVLKELRALSRKTKSLSLLSAFSCIGNLPKASKPIIFRESELSNISLKVAHLIREAPFKIHLCSFPISSGKQSM